MLLRTPYSISSVGHYCRENALHNKFFKEIVHRNGFALLFPGFALHFRQIWKLFNRKDFVGRVRWWFTRIIQWCCSLLIANKQIHIFIRNIYMYIRVVLFSLIHLASGIKCSFSQSVLILTKSEFFQSHLKLSIMILKKLCKNTSACS